MPQSRKINSYFRRNIDFSSNYTRCPTEIARNEVSVRWGKKRRLFRSIYNGESNRKDISVLAELFSRSHSRMYFSRVRLCLQRYRNVYTIRFLRNAVPRITFRGSLFETMQYYGAVSSYARDDLTELVEKKEILNVQRISSVHSIHRQFSTYTNLEDSQNENITSERKRSYLESSFIDTKVVESRTSLYVALLDETKDNVVIFS